MKLITKLGHSPSIAESKWPLELEAGHASKASNGCYDCESDGGQPSAKPDEGEEAVAVAHDGSTSLTMGID